MSRISYTTDEPGGLGFGRSTRYGPRLLVVGVGNELLSDDGVGIHAIRELQERPIPGVTMIELGTAILHGLEFIEAADRVLVLDAAKGEQPPGTIYLFDAAPAAPAAGMTSIHALGLREAANLLLGRQTPPMTVLGVEPATLGYGFELSPPVSLSLPGMLWLARRTLGAWKKTGAREHAGAFETCSAFQERPII